MQPLPHHYTVRATGNPDGNVRLEAGGLPTLLSAPPKAFDGPGDQWSPEDLLLAAVGDCFVLSFRAVARASNLSWTQLDASVEGLLERVDRITRFTEITIRAELSLTDLVATEAAGRRALEKAEKTCLITNSLAVPVSLAVKFVAQA